MNLFNFENYRNSKTILLKCFLIVVFLNLNPLSGYPDSNNSINNSSEKSISIKSEATTTILSIENLKKILKKERIQHAEIVLRQAILETGWFKCSNCSLEKNNIFGFWYKKKFIEFENWKESVAYYKRWQDKHYKGGDYYDFLIKVGYATDPNYIKRLKSIKGL